MTTPDPRTRAQLEVSSRSMPPIEERNPASVPAPSCRAQRSGKLWDQWGREGPRAQAFLHLPHSGLQPLYGLVYEPGWGSPFMPTCPIPGLSCREPPPHTHTHLAFGCLSYSEKFCFALFVVIVLFVNKWSHSAAQASQEQVYLSCILALKSAKIKMLNQSNIVLLLFVGFYYNLFIYFTNQSRYPLPPLLPLPLPFPHPTSPCTPQRG